MKTIQQFILADICKAFIQNIEEIYKGAAPEFYSNCSYVVWARDIAELTRNWESNPISSRDYFNLILIINHIFNKHYENRP